MAITFGDAKILLSEFASRGGKCPDTDTVNRFTFQVLQSLLYSGEYGALRKFNFIANKGIITAPYELEVPLKVKIEGVVGSVWDKWFEWQNIGESVGCVPASEALYEDGNYYATVYDIPKDGSRIGVVGVLEEDETANIIIKGKDTTGREVITTHQGQEIIGEYLSVKKDQLRYTSVIFGEITGIVKTKTNGYVQLLWVDIDKGKKGFLADYSPIETIPQYRRFKLTSARREDCLRVSIIGKIRLKDHYADNDIIPFDNMFALSLAGQQIQNMYNKELDAAKLSGTLLGGVIAQENEYKRVQVGQPIDAFYFTSAGLIQNIV